MSNALSIATVTATLLRIIQQEFDLAPVGAVTGATAKAVPPGSSGSPTKGANIYLFQVSQNAALRNIDLPTRGSGGEIVQRAKLALDLHYLFTFHGDESELEPQRLLGMVTRRLHARPVLTRDAIRSTIQDAVFNTFLGGSDLADAIESVRLTPMQLTLEELSKMWSVFFQTSYSLSVAYVASVVILETDDSPRVTQLVRRPDVFSGSPPLPVITRVSPPIATSDQTLRISGQGFVQGMVKVRFGDLDPVDPERVTPTQIDVAIPGALRAGVTSVQLVQTWTPPSGAAAAPRTFTLPSNVATFVLTPRIIASSPVSVIQGQPLSLTVSPPVGHKQRASLLLGARSVSVGPSGIDDGAESSVTFSIPSDVVPSSETEVALPLQIAVDGAISPITDDPDPSGPGVTPVLRISRS